MPVREDTVSSRLVCVDWYLCGVVLRQSKVVSCKHEEAAQVKLGLGQQSRKMKKAQRLVCGKARSHNLFDLLFASLVK